MADLGIKALDSANKLRKRAGEWLAAADELEAMIKEYDAISVGTEIPIDAFTDITNGEFTTAVGTVKDFFNVWLETSGYKTNLYKLSDGSQR